MNKKELEEITNKHFYIVQESYYILGNFINSTTFTYKEKRTIVELWAKIAEYKPYKQFLKVINEKSEQNKKDYLLKNMKGIEC